MPVPPQPPRVGIDDVRHLGQLVDHSQDLVDLLLVLGDDEPRVGVIDDEPHFGQVRVLVDADRGAARGLRGQLRDHPLGPVVADDGHLAAAREPQRHEAQREIAHAGLVGAPARLAPDAEVLLAQRGASAQPLGVAPQQLGERVGSAERVAHAAASPPR